MKILNPSNLSYAFTTALGGLAALAADSQARPASLRTQLYAAANSNAALLFKRDAYAGVAPPRHNAQPRSAEHLWLADLLERLDAKYSGASDKSAQSDKRRITEIVACTSAVHGQIKTADRLLAGVDASMCSKLNQQIDALILIMQEIDSALAATLGDGAVPGFSEAGGYRPPMASGSRLSERECQTSGQFLKVIQDNLDLAEYYRLRARPLSNGRIEANLVKLETAFCRAIVDQARLELNAFSFIDQSNRLANQQCRLLGITTDSDDDTTPSSVQVLQKRRRILGNVAKELDHKLEFEMLK